MKVDSYDLEAVGDALGEEALRWLEAGAVRLGLPGYGWTAVNCLVVHAITEATLNTSLRENISLDAAAATLLAPGTVTSSKQRKCGPRKNLATWRKQVRNK